MDTITKDQIEKWDKIQEEMATKLDETDRIPVDKVKHILSIYLFIDHKDETSGVVAYTVCDYTKGKYGTIVKTGSLNIVNKTPYITGYLGFREVWIYKKAYQHCCDHFGVPDVVVVNSYGKFHTKKAGSATHLALEIDKPVIGIGRSVIYFDGLNDKIIRKQFRAECQNAGEFLELKGKSGNVYGAAVKTTCGSTNPIYVSVGSYISLLSSIELIINISKDRFPEPMAKAEMIAKNVMNSRQEEEF